MKIKNLDLRLADVEAVFSDIDGTLLNSKGQLTDRTKRAISNLPIPFILCSGRFFKMAQSLYHELGLTTPIITSNGAVIYGRHETIIDKAFLKKSAISDVVSLMTEQSNQTIGVNIFSLDTWYSNELMQGQYAEFIKSVDSKPDIVVKDLSFVPMGKMVKFLAFGEKEELDIYEKYCRKNYGSVFTILHDNPKMFELFPIKSSKGTAVISVCRFLHLKSKNVLGIGDTDMDEALLGSCGFKAALENSNERLRKMADIQTAHTDSDGLAELLEQITESKKHAF